MDPHLIKAIQYAATCALFRRIDTHNSAESALRDFVGLGCGHSIRSHKEEESQYGPYWFVSYSPNLSLQIIQKGGHTTVVPARKFLSVCEEIWNELKRPQGAQLSLFNTTT